MISLSLKLLRFLKLAFVEFGELGLNLGLLLFSLALESILLVLECLLPSSFFCLVFETVGLVHFLKVRLALEFVLFSLFLGLGLLLGKSEPSGFELSHPVELLLLLLLAEAFLFFIGLATGFLLSGLRLKSQALGFGQLGAPLSLGLLLFLSLGLDLKTKLLLFFLLLSDDCKVVLSFVVFNAGFLAFCLLVVLSIDSRVILVLATTALTLGLSRNKFIIFLDPAS